jgi:DMSO/TMAO reductase YedYZ molybdopterin-dependent catalytic subunit
MRRLAIAALSLISIAATATAEPPDVTTIAVTGAVERPRQWTVAELAQQPQTVETVFLHTGHGPLTGSFSGVLLWSLLDQAGVKTDPKAKNDIIRHAVVVTGRDGYSAVLSLGEIAPELGGDQAIVAVTRDGKPLDAKEAPARLIIPGDKAAGRSVEGIATIEVK